MKKEEKVRLPYVPTYGEEVANTDSHAVLLPLTESPAALVRPTRASPDRDAPTI